MKQITPNEAKQILSVKVPKAFWIPSKNMFISTKSYVQIWKFCKANPNVSVKETIRSWAGGTTDDILREIRDGLTERIYLRQFIN